MNRLFAANGSPWEDIERLGARMRAFYQSYTDYDAYLATSHHPRFWELIAACAQRVWERKGVCTLLELGAGRTGFPTWFRDQLGEQASFSCAAHDITSLADAHLKKVCDKIYLGSLAEIEETFDIVFSSYVFEHVVEPQEFLTLSWDLVRPGGSLFIESPRYDFPFYLPPSADHYSFLKRLRIGAWLMSLRLWTRTRDDASFLIHLDPSLFERGWLRDRDAVHWVSRQDVRRFFADRGMPMRDLPPPAVPIRSHGDLKQWLVKNFLTLSVRIDKPVESPIHQGPGNP